MRLFMRNHYTHEWGTIHVLEISFILWLRHIFHFHEPRYSAYGESLVVQALAVCFQVANHFIASYMRQPAASTSHSHADADY